MVETRKPMFALLWSLKWIPIRGFLIFELVILLRLVRTWGGDPSAAEAGGGGVTLRPDGAHDIFDLISTRTITRLLLNLVKQDLYSYHCGRHYPVDLLGRIIWNNVPTRPEVRTFRWGQCEEDGDLPPAPVFHNR